MSRRDSSREPTDGLVGRSTSPLRGFGSPASLLMALGRSARRLTDRLDYLEGRLEVGDEAAWPEYREIACALAAILGQLSPDHQGDLLTTAEMAARLGIAPKTLLKHKANRAIRPALQQGRLIRWKGTETLEKGV